MQGRPLICRVRTSWWWRWKVGGRKEGGPVRSTGEYPGGWAELATGKPVYRWYRETRETHCCCPLCLQTGKFSNSGDRALDEYQCQALPTRGVFSSAAEPLWSILLFLPFQAEETEAKQAGRVLWTVKGRLTLNSFPDLLISKFICFSFTLGGEAGVQVETLWDQGSRESFCHKEY